MRIKKLPAKLSNLQELLAFIADMAGKSGLAPETVNRIELVAEEALVNIIRHAYPSSSGDIEVYLSVCEGPALIVEVRDSGPAFDPRCQPEPDVGAGLADRRPGGLGVLMMRKMTDRLAWRRDRDQNILTLTFFDRG